MYLSIVLAILDIGPHINGRRTRHARRMVADRRAVGGGDWSSDGVHQLWIRDGKGVVASRCDCNVWAVYATILGALNLIHHAIIWRAIINGTLFGGASVWYFYFKPNVAEYFRDLANR